MSINGDRRGGRWVAVAAAVYLVAFVAWVVAGGGSDRVRTVVSDIAFLPVDIAAAAMAWWSTAHLRGVRVSRAWRWIAVGLFSFWLGDVLWCFLEVVRHVSPFPSVADLGYLGFYPCMMLGLLSLPALTSRADRQKLSLDAGIVVLGSSMVVWYLVVAPILQQGSGTVEVLLSLAYPVGDLLLLFAAAVVLLRRVEVADHVKWTVMAAVALFVLSDLAYARGSLTGTYRSGSWTDAGWMAGQVLMIAAAALQQARGPARARREMPRIGLVSSLPYAAVGVCYALVVIVGGRDGSASLKGLLLGAGLMTVLVVARQVSAARENLRLFEEIRRLATTDSLTGLFTRRALVDSAGAALDAAAAASQPVSMVMIDVDRFKQINDTFGHAAGDAVLTTIAARFRRELRSTDLLARYGGDELAAFLPDVSHLDALATAERLRASAIGSPVRTPAGTVDVTISVGVVTLDPPCTLDELMRRADVALYRAKEGGRNRVSVFSAPAA